MMAEDNERILETYKPRVVAGEIRRRLLKKEKRRTSFFGTLPVLSLALVAVLATVLIIQPGGPKDDIILKGMDSFLRM